MRVRSSVPQSPILFGLLVVVLVFVGACEDSGPMAPITSDPQDDSGVQMMVNFDGGPNTPDPMIPADPMAPELYPWGTRHSPVTEYIKDRWMEVSANATRNDDVFAKIGDSITVSTGFMHCFGGNSINWDGRTDLNDTHAYFKAGSAGDGSPYTRDSQAAKVGANASWPIDGSPSPVTKEVSAISPRFAVVMYGTNDIGFYNLDWYAGNLLTLNQQLLNDGVIPVMSTIPPRFLNGSDPMWVKRHNTVVWAIAQSLQIPLVDFYSAVESKPGGGLVGDKVHLNSAEGGSCDFTQSGLNHGNNVRNLVSLEALDRAKRIVVDDEEPFDESATTLKGSGTATDPYVIDSLPFADYRDTRDFSNRVSSYPACHNAGQDESGPEVYYRFENGSERAVAAIVLDRGDVDVDIHLLQDTNAASSCTNRADRIVTRTLPTGTWFFSVDTFVSTTPKSGQYLFVLMEE